MKMSTIWKYGSARLKEVSQTLATTTNGTCRALTYSPRSLPNHPLSQFSLVRYIGTGREPTSSLFNFVANVPEKKVFVIERLGKYCKTLSTGTHFLIPCVDRIAYVHSLEEAVVNIPNQFAVTDDSITIHVNGVLYVKMVDPRLASYAAEDPIGCVSELAQATMHCELSNLTLDEIIKKREVLNEKIVNATNVVAKEWGFECLRYEIKGISPPCGLGAARKMQTKEYF